MSTQLSSENKAGETNGITGILPSGFGAWDITIHPFKGDFVRPSENVEVRNIRQSQIGEGWLLCDCEYPNRKGIRTIMSQHIEQIQADKKLVFVFTN